MKKAEVSEVIYEQSRRIQKFSSTKMYAWWEVQEALKEANIELHEDDILEIGYDPGFYEADNSADPCYFIKLTRNRLETDKEFEERKSFVEKKLQESKNERFKSYLKLKNEFEPNTEIKTNTYKCVVCRKTPVDVFNGFDTCEECINNI